MSNYDFHNDWFFIKANGDIPDEIVDFMTDVFQIMEIRVKVADIKGIVFEVRTKEKCHSVPHLHAKYGEYSISIEIDNADILEGRLPHKQKRMAIEWVRNNKEKLLNEWKDIAISATSITTQSHLDCE